LTRQITRLIGDVHGKFDRYKKIINGSERSIQIGDMGVGFYSYGFDRELRPSTNPPHAEMVKHNSRFIRGNHDNPNVCKKHSQWIKDGTVENDVMFIGGAVSIDKAWRTEGLDYWSDEECSYNDLQVMIDTYMIVKPRVMICHEVPESIAEGILRSTNRQKIEDGSRTRQALQAMLDTGHRPEIFIAGHWHIDIDQVIDGTRFIVLNELSWIDLEI